MNQEKINAAAEAKYNTDDNICSNCTYHYLVHEFDTLRCPTYPDSGKWLNSIFQSYNHTIQRMAFTAGVIYAAANPDVIGCIKLEDALSFGKWADKKGFRWSEKGKVWWKHGNPTRWTDVQLWAIYETSNK